MDTDHRVRLAHHLISTSIFKKLLCPFSGSLELYQTEQAPSSVFHKFFGVRFAGRGSIPSTPIPPRSRPLMLPIPTPNFNPSNHHKSERFLRPDNLLPRSSGKVSSHREKLISKMERKRPRSTRRTRSSIGPAPRYDRRHFFKRVRHTLAVGA